MSEIIEVSSDWLALREQEDARGRSRRLARAAARMLPPGPVVIHDLGSGTGSMMRWLAPLLPGPQTWVLHDWNPDLVERASAGVMPLDRDGRATTVRTRTALLAQLDPADLEGASLVTASALLDVLTDEEVRAVVRACTTTAASAALFSLSVTGEVRLDPADPRDEAFRTAFNAHQERSVGGRRLMGPSGVALAHRLFLEAGWKVRAIDTFWRLGRHDRGLLEEWFDGWLDAALEQRADLAVDGAEYRALRSSQSRRGALSAVVVHTDLLAWP
ncbi:SAM-dependent methyltransferase [Agromyces bauzanensis]